jgi:hypothetical protein
VYDVAKEHGGDGAMTAPVRAAILSIMSRRLLYPNGSWTLLDATRRLASSLARVVEDQSDELDLPVSLGGSSDGNR